MFLNDEGLAIRPGKIQRDNQWSPQHAGSERLFKTGKCFVRCICPKCTEHHSVYMLWTGRGVPRKYCPNCRPLVSSYDDNGLYEASISAPGHPRKKSGRRAEAE